LPLGFACRGGVAQLGERLVRNQKVVSSILITSTIRLSRSGIGLKAVRHNLVHRMFCVNSAKRI
jgi:hypothetical protein